MKKANLFYVSTLTFGEDAQIEAIVCFTVFIPYETTVKHLYNIEASVHFAPDFNFVSVVVFG